MIWSGATTDVAVCPHPSLQAPRHLNVKGLLMLVYLLVMGALLEA
jgi:hypothetical protein